MLPLRALTTIMAAVNLGVPFQTLFFGDDTNIPSTNVAPLFTITETGGRTGIPTHNGSAVEQPWFQVKVRHKKYMTASEAAADAHKKLQLANVQIDDVFFLSIRPASSPSAALGRDANDRAQISFNLMTMVAKRGVADNSGFVSAPGSLPFRVTKEILANGDTRYVIIVNDGGQERELLPLVFP